MREDGGLAKQHGLGALYVVDAGDTFAPSHRLRDADRPRWEATARFIVERFNAQNLDAMSLGDRDLALGRAVLSELKGTARFPILAANLTDAESGAHPFEPFVVLDKGGLRIALIGLLSDTRVLPLKEQLATDGLAVTSAEGALILLKERLEATGADIWVVLSQLPAEEERALADSFPKIRAFIGGDGMGMGTEPVATGAAWSLPGGQKGKQVGLLTVDLQSPGGARAAWQVADRGASLDRKIKQLEIRQRQLQTQREQLERAIEGTLADETPESPARRGNALRLKQISAQLEQAATELKGLEAERAGLDEDPDAKINSLSLTVVPMSKTRTDDPDELRAIEAFREKWPAPPGH